MAKAVECSDAFKSPCPEGLGKRAQAPILLISYDIARSVEFRIAEDPPTCHQKHMLPGMFWWRGYFLIALYSISAISAWL